MRKKRLKIAVFHLAFFYSGGGEKLVLEEIKSLRKRGHEVVCFTPVIEKRLCYPDVINDFSIKTFFPRLPRMFPRQESLEILLTCVFFPLIARKFGRFDVIFGANQPGPWLAWIVKKMKKVPYVIYLAQPTRVLYPRKVDLETGIWVKRRARVLPLMMKLAKPLVRWADKVSIREADEMLVNGEYMSRVLKKTYGRENKVCAAGAYQAKKISRNRWQGWVKANHQKIKKPYILLSNRHFPQKKFEYAIETLPIILKEVPGVSLVITGNPTDYTDMLKRLVKKMSLTEKVIFTGYVTEKDLEKLYQQAAVYVYTSPNEDFGMGVIEAMAAGVPVVAWKKGGPATTIINEKTGFLIKPYSKKELTEKIVSLLKNKKRNSEMGEAGWRRVKRNFTYQQHTDILEEALMRRL